jgi:hypothetical protein
MLFKHVVYANNNSSGGLFLHFQFNKVKKEVGLCFLMILTLFKLYVDIIEKTYSVLCRFCHMITRRKLHAHKCNNQNVGTIVARTSPLQVLVLVRVRPSNYINSSHLQSLEIHKWGLFQVRPSELTFYARNSLFNSYRTNV